MSDLSNEDVLVDDGLSATPLNMGSPAGAADKLAQAAAQYRKLRQPSMGTAASMKKREAMERETLFRLGEAALHWLWHQEHAAREEAARHG